MAEVTRRPPLAAAKARPGLEPLPPFSRFSLRLAANAAGPGLASLNLVAPTQSCQAAQSASGAALWLGPGDWLVLTETQNAAKAAEALHKDLTGLDYALVDISHRQTAIRVSGPLATTWLNAACPLDLDLKAFPVGMCTRTVFAKAQIVLWRVQEQTFHVELWRSFAPYVWDMLSVITAEAA